MYQYINTCLGTVNENLIKRVSDGAIIPFDINNIDYKTYLIWIAAGNTPLPAN
jgi:hypothetical protein